MNKNQVILYSNKDYKLYELNPQTEELKILINVLDRMISLIKLNDKQFIIKNY